VIVFVFATAVVVAIIVTVVAAVFTYGFTVDNFVISYSDDIFSQICQKILFLYLFLETFYFYNLL